MKVIYALFYTVFASAFSQLFAQEIKDYFEVTYEGAELPVYVRGNHSERRMILFVQGGPGETAIDFARSDYPRWRATLEEEVAIAYYDQRGLNLSVGEIDSSMISYKQYGRDLIAIAKALKNRYDTDLYVLGHSAGGRIILQGLSDQVEDSRIFSGAILLNTPVTTGYSEERYTKIRPLYLRNLAKEMIEKGEDVLYWEKAHAWIVQQDSLSTPEDSKLWHEYVDQAFTPVKRKITPGMVVRTVFSRPYSPVRYLNRKDNQYVSDLLWADLEGIQFEEFILNVRIPVLWITGRFDSLAPPEELEIARKFLPSAQYVILPDAAHESFLDQPQMFLESVLRFLVKRPVVGK